MNQPVHYRDFDLKLTRLDGKLYVEALRTPLARASEMHALVLPEELRKWRDVVKLGEAGSERLKDLGGKLFQALFPYPIRQLWWSSVGSLDEESSLRLRLDIRDYELSLIPWEIIHDGEYHLAMYRRRPLVRMLYNLPVVKPATKKPPLKLLLVVSEPTDAAPLSSPRRESQFIVERLRPLVDEKLFAPPVLLDSPTLEGLQAALLDDYDILHFIGHGQFQNDLGSLVLETEEGTARPAAGELLSYPLRDAKLKLVFLNACVTAMPSARNPWMGVAWAALMSGIPAVVAMQGPIRDEAAARFADSFYGTLARGFPLEHCVEVARQTLLNLSYPDYSEWAVPVLFSNSTSGMLWRISRAGRKRKAAPVAASQESAVAPQESAALPAASQPRTAPAHNLTSADYTSFINRQEELDKILKALEPQRRTGVVEITGIGGTGRATLAHEAAARVLEFSRQNPTDPSAFRGIVKLSPRATPVDHLSNAGQATAAHWGLDDLCLTFARTLNHLALKQASPPERIALLRDILSEARYLLLLCDADAVGDPRLIEFLREIPVPSKAIVTSLAPLVTRAQRVPLLSLKLPDALELLRQEAATADVSQIERASPGELETLATNADRLPLILRWSLIRLRESGQPVSWMSRVLAEAEHDKLAEHSLVELLRMLEPPERIMLLTLAAFPAPLTEELAARASALSTDEARPVLSRLEALRLIWLDENSSRYQLLLLTRRIALKEFLKDLPTDALSRFRDTEESDDQYSSMMAGFLNTLPGWLKSAAASEMLRRAVGAMLAFVEAAGAGDFQGVEAQIKNIMWAAAQAFELKDWPAVLRFRRALDSPLYSLGYWHEALQIGQLAYAAAEASNDTDEMAWRALYPLAQMHFYQGRYTEAEQWCQTALDLFGRGREKVSERAKDYELAAAERLLGRVKMAQGELDEAHGLFVSAFRRTRKFRSNDRQLNQLGDVVASLAGLAEQRGQWKEARRGYEWALRVFRRRREPNAQALSAMLHRLGSVALGEKNHDEARRHFRESLALLGNEPNFARRAKVHYSWALLEEELGDLKEARRLLLEARREFQEHAPAPAELARIEAALLRVDAVLSSRAPGVEGAVEGA